MTDNDGVVLVYRKQPSFTLAKFVLDNYFADYYTSTGSYVSGLHPKLRLQAFAILS